MDWSRITELAGNGSIVVERIYLSEPDIAVEGRFQMPPLARLSADDQAFITAFVRGHGSIRQMEAWFSISYPTVKNRLRRIADQLEFVEVSESPGNMGSGSPPAGADEAQAQDKAGRGAGRGAGNEPLDRLERGEITAGHAAELIASRHTGKHRG